MKHAWMLGIIGLLALGGMALLAAQTSSAQTTVSTTPILAPDQVAQDKTPILEYNADIRNLLEDIGHRKSGGFLGKDYEYGKLIAIISDGDEGEFRAFEYDTGLSEFKEYDCSNDWLDVETANVFKDSDSVLKSSGPITVVQFLNHYDCQLNWNWTENNLYYDEVPVFGTSIRANVFEYQAQLKTIIGQKALPVTQTNTLTALQPTLDDQVPEKMTISTSEDRTFFELVNGKFTTPDFPKAQIQEIVAGQPKFIVYQEKQANGSLVPKYVLEIWRFSSYNSDYSKFGARLYLINGTNYESLWERYLLSPDARVLNSEGKPAPLPTEGYPTNKPILLKTGDLIHLEYANAVKDKGRGNVVLEVETYGDGSLRSIAFDSSQDVKFDAARTLRVKFSQAALQYLSTQPIFDSIKQDMGKIYDDKTVSMSLRKHGEAEIPFILVPKDKSPFGPFFKTNTTIAPGMYDLKIRITGFKEYVKPIELSGKDLTGTNDQTLLPGEVKEIDLANLEIDACATCNSIVSCLACVDAGMIKNYSAISEAK